MAIVSKITILYNVLGYFVKKKKLLQQIVNLNNVKFTV